MKTTDVVKVLHFIVESKEQSASPSHTAGIKNRPESRRLLKHHKNVFSRVLKS